MRKESTGSRSESRPEWEQLEDWVRSQVQRLIQELLEEEVTAFLGRAKSPAAGQQAVVDLQVRRSGQSQHGCLRGYQSTSIIATN